jgi:pimeloyl-ACP methyl ester carboxylesterase
MRPAHVIEIVTPKKIVLNGLWLGPQNAKRVFIWLHGLNSSMFSKQSIMELLVDTDTAVIAFNNRGHEKVSTISTTTKKDKTKRGGGAHEVFTDCVDDIDGALSFARKMHAKDIYLVGHSTGCQKSIYWASKKGKGIRGIILLAPVSDYAAGELTVGSSAIKKGERAARKLVAQGRPHELLNEADFPWSELADAQRFLSLYTPDSIEEIFSYTQPEKKAKTLKKVRVPILAVLAENDEYVNVSPHSMYGWFIENIYEGEVFIVPKVTHGFKGAEQLIANKVKDWIQQS